MTEMDNALARELDVELNGPDTAPPPAGGLRAAMAAASERKEPVAFRPAPAPAPRPQTIAEQVGKLEQIERQIDDRIRRESVEAGCEAERKITEARADYERTLAEETARLGRERDEMIRQATDAYHLKMHELAALSRRRQ
jgi:hypothetical protein